jgi:hypothetical protein
METYMKFLDRTTGDKYMLTTMNAAVANHPIMTMPRIDLFFRSSNTDITVPETTTKPTTNILRVLIIRYDSEGDGVTLMSGVPKSSASSCSNSSALNIVRVSAL